METAFTRVAPTTQYGLASILREKGVSLDGYSHDGTTFRISEDPDKGVKIKQRRLKRNQKARQEYLGILAIKSKRELAGAATRAVQALAKYNKISNSSRFKEFRYHQVSEIRAAKATILHAEKALNIRLNEVRTYAIWNKFKA